MNQASSEIVQRVVDVQGQGLAHQIDLWMDRTMDARIGVVGAYGQGKTRALFVKALLLAYENKGCDGLLVVPTFPMARMIHIQQWPALAEELGFPFPFLHGDSAFLWPWGDKLWLRSAEHPERIVGANVAYALVDEPGLMERLAWSKTRARVRDPKAKLRQIICGGTPEGLGWFADLFGGSRPKNRTIWAHEWHPSMAHYPAELLDEFGYDEALLDAYVRGQFVPLRSGRAYRQFSRPKHVRKETTYDPFLPLILGCDFNVDRMRWEALQIGPDWIRYHHEIRMGRGSDTEKACKEFVARFAHPGGSVHRHRGELIVCGDASGAARSTSGKKDYQIVEEQLRPFFKSMRFEVPESNPLQKDRVGTMNYHLAAPSAKERGKVAYIGRGRTVEINAQCTDLIRDLEQVCWKEGSTIEIDKDDENLTHASDAGSYPVWRLAPSFTVKRSVAQGRLPGSEDLNVKRLH